MCAAIAQQKGFAHCLHLLHIYRRPHQSLAAVGVAALTRLITAAGAAMSEDVWAQCMHTLSSAALDTLPQVPPGLTLDRCMITPSRKHLLTVAGCVASSSRMRSESC